VLAVLDDFVQMWNAKERGRDGLVPASFGDEANRVRLRQASTARALCILAVVFLAVLLFVANSWPPSVVVVLWVVLAAIVVAAATLGVRSLGALARAERAADLIGDPEDPPVEH